MTARRRREVPAPGEVLLERSAHLAGEVSGAKRAQVRAAAAELREAAAAEARAVEAQIRAIHRLWLAARAARTAARHEALAEAQAAAAGGVVRRGPWGPVLEPEHELAVDVAAEVGPALGLPAGTARTRVEDAVLLAETLPEVLGALEGGRIGWAQAGVLVEQGRELVVEAPESAVPGGPPVPPPVEAVHRLIAGLLERAPQATAAQLRATARARRAVLVAGAQERARRVARKRRAVWVEPSAEGMAYLHALLEAPVAVAVAARLEVLARGLGQEVPAPGPGLFPCLGARKHAEARSAGELEADVLADLLLDGILPEEPGFPSGVRGRVSVMVPISVLTAEDPTGTTGAGCGSAAGDQPGVRRRCCPATGRSARRSPGSRQPGPGPGTGCSPTRSRGWCWTTTARCTRCRPICAGWWRPATGPAGSPAAGAG